MSGGQTLESLRWKELAELFRDHREMMVAPKVPKAAIAAKLAAAIKEEVGKGTASAECKSLMNMLGIAPPANPADWDETLDEWKHRLNTGLLEYLESGEWTDDMPSVMKAPVLCFIARMYGLSTLLLKSLCATDADPYLSIQSLGIGGRRQSGSGEPKRIFFPLKNEFKEDIGTGARYFHATARVPGSCVSLVQLILGPNGESPQHAHVGSELLICLQGTVVVQHDAQIMTPVTLGRWDCAHFDASLQHKVSNSSGRKNAHLLIVRFLKDPKIARLEPGKHGATIIHRAGFVSLMKRAMSASYAQAGSDISPARLLEREAAVPLRERWKRGQINSLLKGINCGRVTLPDVAHFSKALDVSPVLFFEFLGISGCNHVGGISGFSALENDKTPESKRTMVRMMEKGFRPGGKIIYRIPQQLLKKTDVGVAVIDLPPKGIIKPNKHPGHEILIPIENTAMVQIGDCEGRFPLTAGETLAVFESRRHHVVRNESKRVAKLLVLRCYGTQPEAEVRERKQAKKKDEANTQSDRKPEAAGTGELKSQA
jgi:quercetin dioxygenase-like cupin family protein